MAKIIINMDVELDDSLAAKVLDLLSKTLETAGGRELPGGLELELRDVGGKLLLRVIEGAGSEGKPEG